MTIEDVELDEEEIKVYDWRMEWLKAGGWSKRKAELLAGTDIDYRTANDLLAKCVEKGYSEEFALDLLL